VLAIFRGFSLTCAVCVSIYKSETPHVAEIIVMVTNVTILKFGVTVKVQLNIKNKERTYNNHGTQRRKPQCERHIRRLSDLSPYHQNTSSNIQVRDDSKFYNYEKYYNISY
jgi:hypothetical protein